MKKRVLVILLSILARNAPIIAENPICSENTDEQSNIQEEPTQETSNTERIILYIEIAYFCIC